MLAMRSRLREVKSDKESGAGKLLTNNGRPMLSLNTDMSRSDRTSPGCSQKRLFSSDLVGVHVVIGRRGSVLMISWTLFDGRLSVVLQSR
jgi:hypothetical protein